MKILSFDVGIKHLAYAEVTLVPSVNKLSIDEWKVVETPSNSSDAIENVIDALDAEFYDRCASGNVRFDLVLIENQPALRNPIMKGVQSAIHAYFVMLKKYLGGVDRLHAVSASSKLKIDTTARKDLSYKNRKEFSINTCQRYIEGDAILDRAQKPRLAIERNTDMIARFHASRKKDDLSDAMLQAVWFVLYRL